MLDAMANTVGEALRAVTAQLKSAGYPASDAAELLSRLLGVGRGALRGMALLEFAPLAQATLAAHLARRLAGEPVQYITGRAAFRHLDLTVDRRALIPRPETELLVEAVLEYLAEQVWTQRPPRVLDLGTGSGCIALAVASEHPSARLLAVDASEEALALARTNAHELGLESRVQFLQGAWFDRLGADDRFDVVVSNPPYVSPDEEHELPRDVREWEPRAALFAAEDGLADLREIIEAAPRHLLTGGLLALELAERRAAQVAAWIEGAHDWRAVELRADLAGRPRVLLARREHGPAIAPAQWGEED
jgi:release factor glutamine methyltransferase